MSEWNSIASVPDKLRLMRERFDDAVPKFAFYAVGTSGVIVTRKGKRIGSGWEQVSTPAERMLQRLFHDGTQPVNPFRIIAKEEWLGHENGRYLSRMLRVERPLWVPPLIVAPSDCFCHLVQLGDHPEFTDDQSLALNFVTGWKRVR